MLTVCWLFALAAGTPPQESGLTAQAIMARVAANQDRSDKLRAEYIYHQRIHVASRKTNGRLMCEETAEYLVTPTAQGTSRKLERVKGRYWHKGQYSSFDRRPTEHRDGDGDVDVNVGAGNATVDCQVADQLGNNLTDDKSKDGIVRDLFPLTTKKQTEDRFELIGEDTRAGRRVYRVSFKPKDKADFDWAGEADIDVRDFEPVDVYTKLSRRIPFVVRALLVALPGVGFSVQYQPQPDGVWFPHSFGTEFELRLLMFYRRLYTVSLENDGFQHTRVSSTLKLVGPVGDPKPVEAPK